MLTFNTALNYWTVKLPWSNVVTKVQSVGEAACCEVLEEQLQVAWWDFAAWAAVCHAASGWKLVHIDFDQKICERAVLKIWSTQVSDAFTPQLLRIYWARIGFTLGGGTWKAEQRSFGQGELVARNTWDLMDRNMVPSSYLHKSHWPRELEGLWIGGIG